MNIELKRVKLGPGSRETIQFTGDLYVDGKLIAFLDDSGHGGDIEITVAAFYEEGKDKEFKEKREALSKILESAEKYCKTLPPVQPSAELIQMGLDKPLKMDLQLWMSMEVGKLASQKEIKKEIARLGRLCETKIIILSKKQVDDFISEASNKYPDVKTINLKKPLRTFNQEELKKYIKDKLVPQLKGDEYIYNKNIPKLD